jgi:hypothetical protein
MQDNYAISAFRADCDALLCVTDSSSRARDALLATNNVDSGDNRVHMHTIKLLLVEIMSCVSIQGYAAQNMCAVLNV